MLIRAALFVALAFTIACGSAVPTNNNDAAPPDNGVDARVVYDAGPEPGRDGGEPDAEIPDDVDPGSTNEVTGAAGRVSGAGFTADVQIGHGHSMAPSTDGTHTMRGAAAIH